MFEWVGTAIAEGPIWAVALALFGGMLASAVVGYRLRSRQPEARAQIAGASNDRTNEGIMVSAVFGLFALLTGFTFAMAVERYDARRTAVLTEANLIGTAYLRTQLLEEPHRARISRLLIDYADQRVALAQADTTQARVMIARNDRLVGDLWDATQAAFPSIRTLPFSAGYLDSMNALIDQDMTRKMTRFAHVPPAVLLLLFVYALSASGVIGYVMSRDRGRASAAMLFILFGTSLLLIIDIDRPRSGWIRESQLPMTLLVKDLHQRADRAQTSPAQKPQLRP